MNKSVENLYITNITQINATHFTLVLKATSVFPTIVPGQFVNVLVEDADDVYLRRPFSIHDVNNKEKTFSLLIKNVGKGTEALQKKKVGDKLNIIYPLGKGYSLDTKGKVLLIGGGFGVAPLYYLAKELHKKQQTDIHLLVGAKTKKDILLTEKFEGIAQVHTTTEDGSTGETGYVTQHSIMQDNFSQIYTCGPTPMTEAIAKYAIKKDIPCEVSLENMMACGYGVCLCCVTKSVTNENLPVCTQGTVFNVKELQW